MHVEGLNLPFKLLSAAFWVALNCWVCGLSLPFCNGACPTAFLVSGGEGHLQRSIRWTEKLVPGAQQVSCFAPLVIVACHTTRAEVIGT